MRGDEHAKVLVEPRFAVNDFDLVYRAALEGIRMVLLPPQRASDDLRQGRLVRLLPEWCTPTLQFHAVYPSERHLSRKMKASVEHLQNDFAEVERSSESIGPALSPNASKSQLASASRAARSLRPEARRACVGVPYQAVAPIVDPVALARAAYDASGAPFSSS